MSEPIRDESAERANTLVAAFALRRFRKDFANAGRYCVEERHLANCKTVRLEVQDAYTGDNGCETGCELAVITSTVSRNCGLSLDWQWSDFGNLPSLIEDLIKEADGDA